MLQDVDRRLIAVAMRGLIVDVSHMDLETVRQHIENAKCNFNLGEGSPERGVINVPITSSQWVLEAVPGLGTQLFGKHTKPQTDRSAIVEPVDNHYVVRRRLGRNVMCE